MNNEQIALTVAANNILYAQYLQLPNPLLTGVIFGAVNYFALWLVQNEPVLVIHFNPFKISQNALRSINIMGATFIAAYGIIKLTDIPMTVTQVALGSTIPLWAIGQWQKSDK